jgi:hypothetical protein
MLRNADRIVGIADRTLRNPDRMRPESRSNAAGTLIGSRRNTHLHRRPAIVRRNMLFAGSYEGARRAAVVFTILACLSTGTRNREDLSGPV